MDKNGKWYLSPAYDITYSKGILQSHTTTIAGKDKDITRKDVLNIAKTQSIKPKTANKIIDDCIKAIQSFEEKAKKIKLDKNTISECVKDIQTQINLLKVTS